jgi:phosphoglucomutase
MQQLDKNAVINAEKWLKGSIDESVKQEILSLKENNISEFNDAFYKTLEFGTGGLRGVMGIGTNRMNKYVIAMTTQGFCNYIRQNNPNEKIRTVISYDSRNNSKEFATITARVMAANGFDVFLFEDIRPTPELSFAVRELKANAGVMITASHNPKEYNGYKAYWNDGAQLTAPHDELVIEQVNAITDLAQVKMQDNDDNITIIGEEIDKIYLEKVKALSLNSDCIKKHKDLKIVYTPLHGTGIALIPRALKDYGFENVICVEEQSIPDGNFPTCVSPNPEDVAALELGLKLAKEIDADVLLATDPDADREAIALKDNKGEWIILNGNQTASLLTYYLLSARKESNLLKGKEFVIKTVVTTEMVKKIADSFEVECFDVLTGFKHIASKIKDLEGIKEYIGGGEESFGYLIGDFVRDKDSVSACCILAEMVVWAKETHTSLYDFLLQMYTQYGFFLEKQVSITRKGKTGTEEIQQMMHTFRTNPPTALDNDEVVEVIDYLETEKTNLPKSNVLQYLLKSGSKVSVRPSGTEPKIKFYFSITFPMQNKEEYEHLQEQASQKIERIKTQLGL